MKGLFILLVVVVCAKQVELRERLVQVSTNAQNELNEERDKQRAAEYAPLVPKVLAKLDEAAKAGEFWMCMTRSDFPSNLDTSAFCEWWNKHYDLHCGKLSPCLRPCEDIEGRPYFRWSQ